MEGLRRLADELPIIGDVFGLGLFLGVELVRDRQTLEPADREAETIVEKLRERGILLSIDGPLRDVLKIKPPLVVTKSDADHLLEVSGRAELYTATQVSDRQGTAAADRDLRCKEAERSYDPRISVVRFPGIGETSFRSYTFWALD